MNQKKKKKKKISYLFLIKNEKKSKVNVLYLIFITYKHVTFNQIWFT